MKTRGWIEFSRGQLPILPPTNLQSCIHSPESINMNQLHFPDHTPQSPSGPPNQPCPTKNLRGLSGKCDSCYTQSIRCRREEVDDPRCGNCIKSGYKCSYENHLERTDTYMEGGSGQNESRSSSMNRESDARTSMGLPGGDENGQGERTNGGRYQVVGRLKEVLALVEVYFEVVYPL